MIDFNEYNPDGGISDELLAAYLDGNTTPAETSWIESALQWDDSLAETLEIASDSRVAEEPGFVDAWQRAEADAWGQRMEWEPLSVGDSSTDSFKVPDTDDNDWEDAPSDELLPRLNDIQDIPVSEEMIGAYVERKLNVSDLQKVEEAFSNLAGMNDFGASARELIDQKELDASNPAMHDFIFGIDAEILTDLNFSIDAINMDEPSTEEKNVSAYGDREYNQTLSFLADNNKTRSRMKEHKTFGYEPNKAENKYDPIIDQGSRPSCAIRSQEIILRDYGIAIPQEELITFASQQGWYSDDPEHGGTPRHAIGNLLEVCGIPTMRTENATIYDIIAELRAGHRVIVCVDADELWVKQEPTLYKRLFGELKNRAQDAVDKLNGVQGANHALIVAGVTVNPKAPSNMHVTLIDSGSGDVCITYSLKDFQNALEDSNCYMVSTTIPAPYQYNYETHEMEPSSFNTNYYPSMAALPVGFSNEFSLEDSYYEKYADYEPVYDVIAVHSDDCEQAVHAGDDLAVQQCDDTNITDANVLSYNDDTSFGSYNDNMEVCNNEDTANPDYNTLLSDATDDNDDSLGANVDNPSNDDDYDN